MNVVCDGARGLAPLSKSPCKLPLQPLPTLENPWRPQPCCFRVNRPSHPSSQLSPRPGVDVKRGAYDWGGGGVVTCVCEGGRGAGQGFELSLLPGVGPAMHHALRACCKGHHSSTPTPGMAGWSAQQGAAAGPPTSAHTCHAHHARYGTEHIMVRDTTEGCPHLDHTNGHACLWDLPLYPKRSWSSPMTSPHDVIAFND